MRDAECLRDLAKVASCCVLLMHHTCATNYFQVSDFGEVSQDFILDAVSEIRVGFIFAQIFKRKHGDAFFRRR